MIKCKFRAYGLKTLNQNHLDNFRAEEVWKNRLTELQRVHDRLCEDRDSDQIFKANMNVESQKRSDAVTCIKDKEGNMLQDVESIYDFLLKYNVEKIWCENVVKFGAKT